MAAWPNAPRNTIANPLPLPCHPRHPVQWEGCGAYFCQYPRPVGDNRPQCPTILKECTECAVLVCDQCTAANPACTCTYCTVNFHCPTCTRKPDVRAKCRLEAETKARLEDELRTQERLKREREGRYQADELAGAVFEFFRSLDTDEEDEPLPSITHQEMIDLIQQNPLNADQNLQLHPSPDSITVTTEFGVHEEPSHVTVISGPSTASQHHHQVQYVSDLEYVEQVLMHGPPGPSEAEMDAMLVESDDHPDSDEALGSIMNGDADADADADIDTDDFDGPDDFDATNDFESAVIDEFVDDGGLTPTTATIAAANI